MTDHERFLSSLSAIALRRIDEMPRGKRRAELKRLWWKWVRKGKSRNSTPQGRLFDMNPRLLKKTIGIAPGRDYEQVYWEWHDPAYRDRFFAEEGVRGYSVYDANYYNEHAMQHALYACATWIESRISDDPGPRNKEPVWENNPSKAANKAELRAVTERLASANHSSVLHKAKLGMPVGIADAEGLITDEWWDESHRIQVLRDKLWSRRYDLRVLLGLDPRTGLPKEKQRRRRAPVTEDDLGGGWYPDLLGPTEDVRGLCRDTPERVGWAHGSAGRIEHNRCEDGLKHHMVYEVDGEPVSGLTLKAKKPWRGSQSATIDRVFTAEGHRRKGYAAELLGHARSEFRKVEHSRDLTGQGRAWKKAMRNPANTALERGLLEAAAPYWGSIAKACAKSLPMPASRFLGDIHDPSQILGCGFWGCVFKTADPRFVVKLSLDITEGPLVAMAMDKFPLHPGLAYHHRIWRLPHRVQIAESGSTPLYVILREEVDLESVWSSKKAGRRTKRIPARGYKRAHDALESIPEACGCLGESISDVGHGICDPSQIVCDEAKLKRLVKKIGLGDPKSPGQHVAGLIKGAYFGLGILLGDSHFGNVGLRHSNLSFYNVPKHNKLVLTDLGNLNAPPMVEGTYKTIHQVNPGLLHAYESSIPVLPR